jgi:hypothetical protein
VNNNEPDGAAGLSGDARARAKVKSVRLNGTSVRLNGKPVLTTGAFMRMKSDRARAGEAFRRAARLCFQVFLFFLFINHLIEKTYELST